MKVYKSKIDWWIVAIVVLPLLFSFALAVAEDIAVVFIVNTFILLLLIWLYRETKYIIDGNVLYVKAGIIINQQIQISQIRSVVKTNNPLSAPAFSLKRLEIRYGSGFDFTLISPQNREEFVKDLLKINPDIQVAL